MSKVVSNRSRHIFSKISRSKMCNECPTQIITKPTIISQEPNGDDDFESPTRPVYPLMGEEQKRISSFGRMAEMNGEIITSLAKFGYFYSVLRTAILCYCCELKFDYRQGADDIYEQHATKSPDCEFIKSIGCKNRDARKPLVHQGPNLPTGLDEVDLAPNVHADNTQNILSASNLYAAKESAYVWNKKHSDERKCKIVTDSSSYSCIRRETSNDLPHIKDPLDLGAADGVVVAKPKYKRYATVHTRVSTYLDKWPKEKNQKAEQLAKAGFFYVGREDAVRCFFCNVGLKNWQKGDNPWLEHARWFPRCGYLRQSRGMHFINTVQRLKKLNKANLNNPDIRFLLRDVLHKDGIYAEEEKTVSPAVESVITMGYTLNEVTTAMAKLMASGNIKDSKQIMADEIMAVLFENEADVTGNVSKTDRLTSNTDMNSADNSDTSSEFNSDFDCKICMENSSSILFVPCGHLVTCAECAFAFDSCPLCRKNITGTLRVSRENENVDLTKTE